MREGEDRPIAFIFHPSSFILLPSAFALIAVAWLPWAPNSLRHRRQVSEFFHTRPFTWDEVAKACYQTLAVRWEDEPPSAAAAWGATAVCLLPALAMLVWGRGGLRLVGLCVLATFDGAICASISDRNIIGSRYFVFAQALLLCGLPPLLVGRPSKAVTALRRPGKAAPRRDTGLPRWRFGFTFDRNLDGFLTADEFLAIGWGKNVALRSERALDADGDGRVSLSEFRSTTFANQGSDWMAPRQDTDGDGRISFAEFYREKPPHLIAQSRFFFDAFDLDHDGFLSYAEMEFDVDPAKVPAEILFAARDLDADCKLLFAEFFSEAKPPDTDAPARDRYEMRLAAEENRFMQNDKVSRGLAPTAKLRRPSGTTEVKGIEHVA